MYVIAWRSSLNVLHVVFISNIKIKGLICQPTSQPGLYSPLIPPTPAGHWRRSDYQEQNLVNKNDPQENE